MLSAARPSIEGLVDWGRPRIPIQRLGSVWTSGGCQGGREGEEEGKVLWRANAREGEGEGKADCLLSLSKTGTYTRNRTLGEIYP